MNWPSSSNKSGLNNNSGGNILKGSQSGVKNRTPLPPIRQTSKKPQDPKTAQNTQTHLQLGGQSEGIIRSYKEEGQIEMAGIDNDSSSHEEQNVINSKQGSYISANSTERRELRSQKPDSFTKIHKILSKCICSGAVFWLYMIFIFIFGIITISVCGSASTELSKLKDSEAYLYSQETLNLWHNRFIMDIILTKGQTCPQNYEQALNYQWPGTLQGCACPYTVQNMQQIFLVKGKCNAELLSYNCYDVDPTAPQFINTWKNGQLICIQRDPNNSFFNSPTSCNSNNPQSNLRACGTGQTAVCVSSTQNCPVSYVQSQNNDNIVGNTQVQVTNLQSLHIFLQIKAFNWLLRIEFTFIYEQKNSTVQIQTFNFQNLKYLFQGNMNTLFGFFYKELQLFKKEPMPIKFFHHQAINRRKVFIINIKCQIPYVHKIEP